MRSIDITGMRFGRLTAVRRAGRIGKESAWECECDCGRNSTAPLGSLRSGKTRSCGCLRAEMKPRLTHGLKKHPLYRVWGSMVARCHKPHDPSYEYYGARGISVCEEWRSDRIAFVRWGIANGWRLGLTIDRINNDGNYEPANCRFATWVQQANNKRQPFRSGA